MKQSTRNRSVLLAVGAFLLSNLKWLWSLLKFSKFGGTLISMAVSLSFYAAIYGWKFAAALIYLIFIHEMGHLVAAKMKGIRTSPAIFIPFVGAVISMKEQPRDARTEAFLAYGGPFAGLISFLPAVPLYLWTNEPFWGLVIFLGAMINLFNLLPVSPLDGGRIVSVLSSKVWLIGLILMGGFLYFSPSPLLFLIFLLGLFTWWSRVREGYQQRVLSYEKEKLLDLIEELRLWPNYWSMSERRSQLYAEVLRMEQPPKQQRFYLPFLQDEKRFARDREQLDREFAQKKWDLLQRWERSPTQYEDGDPNRPLPSPLLSKEIEKAAERMQHVEERLHRLSTYYESATATKWKVLAAYLGLALVLSLFLLYGNGIMEQHQELLMNR
ncbi:site-2 protease family protein [Brevibacillus humidisoli]|uniref:site-2 protease family protein n=1 Tax=Brevibacillus humidisoli TaxID=2895522 RepID=UPI001E3C2B06|nr:site-2 protease family protein [Brevibacillus humidisoli]UFJ41187.1 site-2 protease family protein [Brevibacillus humidisoli]